MSDPVIAHYERRAHQFDRDRRGAFGEQPWLERFILPLPKGGTVLDLGCGSGEPVARFLVDRGFRLTGVDGSPTMIGLARTRFPRHEWLLGDMRGITFVRQFDAVLAWCSLCHLAQGDQLAMLARIGRWLRPGGRLLFNAAPAGGRAAHDDRDAPFDLVSPDPAEFREALREAALAEIAFSPTDARCDGMAVWLARKT